MVPRWTVYVAGLIPAAWALGLGLNDALGAEPIKELEHLLGLWALRFLLAALAVTPLRQLTGVNLLRYRRALGLLAFYYAALHLAVYLLLDQGLDAGAIAADVLKRPYITVGFASFLVLLPLAATSTNGMIRRLGGRAWARLHRFVYLAAALAALHFVLVVKSWPAEPLIYAAACAALLASRAYPAAAAARRGPRT
ncbi:protein-methionine-sulfoxide reductase heme-binding subunit MsrQ [Chelatococcus reniformis]|nr:protein-methionine-sulfoxide reductase heme-binding subunit MsrQ [Chelatococcus reniformis]